MFQPTVRRALTASVLALSCSLLPLTSLEAAPLRQAGEGSSRERLEIRGFTWAGFLADLLERAGIGTAGAGSKVIEIEIEPGDDIDEAGVRIDGNGLKAGVRIDGNG